MIARSVHTANKGIHVNLPRNVYGVLRAKLFMYGLSMQQVFTEFARLIATDSPTALKILSTMSDVELGNIVDSRTLMEELTPETKRKKQTPKADKKVVFKVAGVNVDTLYDMIDSENAKKLAEQKAKRESEEGLEEFIQDHD
jgi:hypothetical protein